jgi:hypothetical protein
LAFSTSVRSSPAASSTTPLNARLIGTMPATVGITTSIGDTLLTPWLPEVACPVGGCVTVALLGSPKFGSVDGAIVSDRLTVPAACN